MHCSARSTTWQRLRKSVAISALISAAGALGACATTTASGGTDPPAGAEQLGRAAFCDVAEPIRWADQDTDATIAQVKEHNAVGVRLCAW